VYELEQTSSFKKDLKRAKKRGLSMSLIDDVITQLVTDGELSRKYKPHKLKGNYEGLWECHIQPDWLLIWDQDDVIRLISLIRTGSHSDLF